MLSHEASNSSNGGVLPQTYNLSVSLNSVVLEGLKGNGLGTTLDLLGLGVNLLLSLLSSSTKTENKVKGGLLLDVVVGKSTAILELLSSEDETLLIRGDSLLILDLGLYVVDGVGRLNIECNGLSCIVLQGRCIYTMNPRRLATRQLTQESGTQGWRSTVHYIKGLK